MGVGGHGPSHGFGPEPVQHPEGGGLIAPEIPPEPCISNSPHVPGSATPFQLSDAGASVCALCDTAHRSDAGTGVIPASASVCLFTQIAAASHPFVGYGGDRCVRCGQVATVIISTGGHYGLCTSRTGGDSYHFDRKALRALQFLVHQKQILL